MTAQQLAILRAALRYFDEEFSPSGPSALERELPGWGITPQDVTQLRTSLTMAKVRYVLPQQLHRRPALGRESVLWLHPAE